MVESVSYTVTYKNDVLKPIVSEQNVYGVVAEIFREFFNVKHAPRSLEYGKEYCITSMTLLGLLSRTAAKRLPASIISTDKEIISNTPYETIEYSVISHAEPENDVVPMLMPIARERLVMAKDPARTKELYKRYVDLYNDGEAIFGARLVNIEEITFKIYNFE